MPKKKRTKPKKTKHLPMATDAAAVLASAVFDYKQAMASLPDPKAK